VLGSVDGDALGLGFVLGSVDGDALGLGLGFVLGTVDGDTLGCKTASFVYAFTFQFDLYACGLL